MVCCTAKVFFIVTCSEGSVLCTAYVSMAMFPYQVKMQHTVLP